MNVYFFGGGTDAGGWYIGADGKIHRFPGWNPEAVTELSHALRVLREGSQLKTPGLADRAIKSVLAFAQKELGKNIKGGGVVVLG